MAAGPSETLPVGTRKQEQLLYYQRIIDRHIRCSEGETAVIDIYELGYASVFDTYKDEIIHIYELAGWKYVYVDEVSFDSGPKLVLTNNVSVLNTWGYYLDHPKRKPGVWDFIKRVVTMN